MNKPRVNGHPATALAPALPAFSQEQLARWAIAGMQAEIDMHLQQVARLKQQIDALRTSDQPIKTATAAALFPNDTAPTAPTDGKLLTTKQAAKLLKMSPAFIQKRAKDGRLRQAGKRGRSAVYYASEIEALRETHNPTSAEPLLTTADVAKRYRVSANTVNHWVHRGYVKSDRRSGIRSAVFTASALSRMENSAGWKASREQSKRSTAQLQALAAARGRRTQLAAAAREAAAANEAATANEQPA